MSTSVVRLTLPIGLVILLAGVIAWAQDRHEGEPAGRNAVEVFISVEGRNVVITSLPEGVRVEKGDTICELDPSELRDRLARQEIVVRGAEHDFRGATLAREAAGMRIVEYVEGQFRNELATTAGEIKQAEARLAGAEDHLDWSRRMFEKGYVSKAEWVADELTLKTARFALEVGESRRIALLNYTKGRALKMLRSEAETAMSLELAKEARLMRERSAQKRLTNQIGLCKVAAPARGRIMYGSPIGAGAVVHDGQLLCRVVTEGASTTKAK